MHTLHVAVGEKLGMAVSPDGKWLVVGVRTSSQLFVYSLPEGELVRSFGAEGIGPLKFGCLSRLCFAPNGNILVAECRNRQLQEVTPEGVFVRLMMACGDGPLCVALVAM